MSGRPSLRAGTGRADVSPQAPCFLWGYPHVARTSTGIHDPLYATALCLDDGTNRTVAVAVDILYLDAPLVASCRERIEARCGVPGRNVLLSASHTHSGPVTCDVLAMQETKCCSVSASRHIMVQFGLIAYSLWQLQLLY